MEQWVRISRSDGQEETTTEAWVRKIVKDHYRDVELAMGTGRVTTSFYWYELRTDD